MKNFKLSFLFLLAIATSSCSDNEDEKINLGAVSFTATPSSEDSSVYNFVNTTANKEAFYSYWKFSQIESSVADNGGTNTKSYPTDGPRRVTLTVVSGDAVKTVSKDILVMLPVLPPPPPPLPTDNLLLNGGFEAGTGNDFTNWSKANGADRFSEETADVQSGARAIKVSNTVDGLEYETQLVSDSFDTVEGESYSASLWIKGTASVRFSTNPNAGNEQYAGGFVATSDWAQYTWSFTANTPTTTLALDMGLITGDFIVDTIEVTLN